MLNPKRIAVLASGGGTNLQAVIDAMGSVIKNGALELVISNKSDAFALERAKKAGIPACFIPHSAGERDTFEQEALSRLKSHGIDLIVLAGFMSILSKDFISHYKNRIINVHPALIPSFCGKGYYGLKVHEAAISYGVKVTGATVHYVNEIPDGGEIILQRAVEVEPNDTPETLQRRVMEQAEWIILPQAIEIVINRLIKEEQCTA